MCILAWIVDKRNSGRFNAHIEIALPWICRRSVLSVALRPAPFSSTHCLSNLSYSQFLEHRSRRLDTHHYSIRVSVPIGARNRRRCSHALDNPLRSIGRLALRVFEIRGVGRPHPKYIPDEWLGALLRFM